jgi:hyperosmotically inducible protein
MDDSTGHYVDGTVITTKVKSALLGDDAVNSFPITVETHQGVVQLSGFAATSDQKSAAGKDASGVPSVKDVKNDLSVKEPAELNLDSPRLDFAGRFWPMLFLGCSFECKVAVFGLHSRLAFRRQSLQG